MRKKRSKEVNRNRKAMSTNVVEEAVSNNNSNAGDAVGIPNKHWFVAIVNNNSEKVYGKRIKELDYESYVPVQKETHHWRNGKVKTIDHIM